MTTRKTLEWQKYPFPDDVVSREQAIDHIYQIPQFKFRHSLALLSCRKTFAAAHILDTPVSEYSGSYEYGDYLLSVYEALLANEQLSQSMLMQCSKLLDPLVLSSSSSSSSSPSSSSTCMRDSAYNLILTKGYMLLVPRSAWSTTEDVNINSFAFLGLVMMNTVLQRDEAIKVGLMGILNDVTFM
jgi:hypothetical protein